MARQKRLPMTPTTVDEERIVEVNERVWFVDNDGFRVVYVGWESPLYRVALDDAVQMRFVAVSLHQTGLARQSEIARAFNISVATLRRWARRYAARGSEGLRRKTSPGRTLKITGSEEACIRKWFEAGETNSEMARRLGVNEGTVRNALKRMDLHRPRVVETAPLRFVAPEAEETAEPPTQTPGEASSVAGAESCAVASCAAAAPSFAFGDPLDRSLDRLLARMGKIDDAPPLFADTEGVPGAGVLLAIPLLVQSGLLEIFTRLYRSIGPAFYGLRTTVVCLFVLSLLRIKRPENLKEYNPEDLGRLLGLDRAPEVKTLRRKLDALAGRNQGLELMRALAERRIRDQEDRIGVLYVDGHVKEYHGKAKVGKTFITCRRLSAPAATDTWVNDVNGDPLFVVSSELNESLTATLKPVLSEIRQAVGDTRRITVIFDRGGWSPKLFHQLIESGFDIITYRKGHNPTIPAQQFEKREFVENGTKYEYHLHDQPRVRVGRSGAKAEKAKRGEKRKKAKKSPKYLWLRQVTRHRDNGHQTPVITNRTDLPPEKVLYLMFHRWRQENFFKYMREEFALDGLLEHGAEPVIGKDRPNPARTKIDKELRQVRATLAETERLIGIGLADNEESKRPSVRGFKIAHAGLLRQAEGARKRIAQLNARKAKLPKRVPASDLESLKKDRKVIADSIKMVAYQTESELARMLGESYARCDDEGRTLLQAAFQSRGDLEVKDGEIRVTLAPQSSPHRTLAIKELSEKLTTLGVKFPGTGLRLSLAVAEPLKIR
jgi:transposase